MITNILSMNGYGLFVWLSFGITLTSCFLVFLHTKKTLKKYEKEFAYELKQLKQADRELVLKKSKIANQVFVSQKKTA